MQVHKDIVIIQCACYHQHEADPTCGNITLSADRQFQGPRWRPPLKAVEKTRLSWEGREAGQQQGWQGGVKMLQVRGDEDLEQGCGRGDGDRDPDAERSTGRFSQSLNEDQRVEKSWLSCLRRPLEKFGIHNKNTEHSKGPGGERWSYSFTRLLRKRFSVGEDYQQSRDRTEKLAFRVGEPHLCTNNSHSYSETQFIFHGVGPSSYSTVIVDLCRSLSRDNPLLNSRNLTHVQLKVTSGH